MCATRRQTSVIRGSIGRAMFLKELLKETIKKLKIKQNLKSSENKYSGNTYTNRNLIYLTIILSRDRSSTKRQPRARRNFTRMLRRANNQDIRTQQALKNLTAILKAMAGNGTGDSSDRRTEMRGENQRRGQNRYRGWEGGNST